MRTHNTTSLFETQAACKFYRPGTKDEVRALEDVSLTIPAGSLAALVGPSGSGKSTLLSLLGALDRASRGKVLFEGSDLSGLSDMELARVRRRVGFIFQNYSLLARLPVWENITYPLIPRGVCRADRLEIAQRLLEQFGLPEKAGDRPEELSGGEQQRVAVCRALAAQPDVLLADEPTSNLDRRSGSELCSILNEICSSGKTLVISTHDPEILACATHVFELEEGKLRRAELDREEAD